jgi:hypothetical protein
VHVLPRLHGKMIEEIFLAGDNRGSFVWPTHGEHSIITCIFGIYSTKKTSSLMSLTSSLLMLLSTVMESFPMSWRSQLEPRKGSWMKPNKRSLRMLFVPL